MPYFTAKQFHDHINLPNNAWQRGAVRSSLLGQRCVHGADEIRTLTLKECKAALREAHRRLATRDNNLARNAGLAKWFRPWDVVPELANFQVPPNDFSVGIEIEMGFRSPDDAAFFAPTLLRMKNVTLDWEGGTHPIEATFPPFLYSKMSSRTQALRYSGMLRDNRERLVHHNSSSMVGTHVNVGHRYIQRGGVHTVYGYSRLTAVNNYISSLSGDRKEKYFGRRVPYRYGVYQTRFIEWKMFNSVPDPERLRSYIHIAVELTRVLVSDLPLTNTQIQQALDTGFRKVYKNGELPA